MTKWLILAVSMVAASGAFAAPDEPPPGYQKTEWQKQHTTLSRELRMKAVNPVAAGALRLRPTFVSCGAVYGAPECPAVAFSYRKKGAAEWTDAPKPVWFYDAENWRGSAFDLEEDADYEFRVTADGRVLATQDFRTWASRVPIAKTVTVDPAKVTLPLRITAQGDAQGWIRYTAKKGAVFGDADRMESVIVVDGARYVFIDGFTIRGGGGEGHSPVMLTNACCVRVCNCEISGWGRPGVPDYECRKGWNGCGKPRQLEPTGEHVVTINNDCAIHVGPGCAETVIERCYVHDPRMKANAWFYSHPSGPEAVMMGRPDHSTVIRHCDFVGSDKRRFNDCVEGWYNFVPDGGFNQDADVYGNFMIFANDDNIELDGGQQNVRCFKNRFESAVSHVSLQGCIVSPVYVFDNLFAGGGDEFDFRNPRIKTAGFHDWWYAPYAAVFGNILSESGNFLQERGETARWDVRGNDFVADVNNATYARYPVRDVGFVLDRLTIRDVEVRADIATPAATTVKVTSTSDRPQPFEIRKNDDATWFAVTPQKGVVPPGGEIELTVSFDGKAIAGRRDFGSAFLVRKPNGLSRPVSVYARRTDFTLPTYPKAASDTTVYVPHAGSSDGLVELAFDVRRAGRYWFLVRAKSLGPRSCQRAEVSVDGCAFEPTAMPLWRDRFTWTIIRPGKYDRCCNVIRHYDLQPGRHVLQLRPIKDGKYEISDAVVTDDPGAFEPR